MKCETKALPFDVAAACGYVPEFPQPLWKRWKNRLLLRFRPKHPPRLVIPRTKELDYIPKGPVNFLPGWPSYMGLPPEKRAEAKARGLVLPDMESINHVLNQSPNEVGAFWQQYDKDHPEVFDQSVKRPVPPGIPSGLTEEEALASLMQMQTQVAPSYFSKPVSKVFDDAGFPPLPTKHDENTSMSELPKDPGGLSGKSQADQGQKSG